MMWIQNIRALRGRYGVLTRSGVVLAMALCMLSGSAWAVGACGSLERESGPWDYNDPEHRSQQLGIVEKAHFYDEIVRLQGSTSMLAGNISYTLSRFPNHHPALDAMSRLALREKIIQPDNAEYTVECYFERAVRWRPRDATVRLVFAIHHYRSGRIDEAIAQAREGLKLAPNNVELHYNLGLFLVRKGDYAGARRHAQQAYRQGYPLTGLRRQLERAGQWTN